ncbi:hypothetical protein HaLaN_01872 [Haematococcus lacustris]|uniref:Uncharacterized protein n=1 Tax=Haematococcus lacustris TaxID=44745 RepID=A0A699YJD8_HAELA|nr:hypothetical protein HaLaN_01872 [Haematococcus lacustris]
MASSAALPWPLGAVFAECESWASEGASTSSCDQASCSTLAEARPDVQMTRTRKPNTALEPDIGTRPCSLVKLVSHQFCPRLKPVIAYGDASLAPSGLGWQSFTQLCIFTGKPKLLEKATTRRTAHRVMAKKKRKGSDKHKKDPGKKQKGKQRQERRAGARADVRCRPRLMCPRTVCVPALCLGLSKWPVKMLIVLGRKSSRSRRALCCAGESKPDASYGRISSCGLHSQIASLFVLRIFLTCLAGYPTPGYRSATQPPAHAGRPGRGAAGAADGGASALGHCWAVGRWASRVGGEQRPFHAFARHPQAIRAGAGAGASGQPAVGVCHLMLHLGLEL